MLKLYTTPSCSSCRKTKDWLDSHNIEYKERNLLVHTLSREEVLDLLKMTVDGTTDIISNRSKDYEKIVKVLDKMSLNELADFIVKHPKVLKRPLICSEDGKKFYSGFNEDDIRIFLPKELGSLEFFADRDCDVCEFKDEGHFSIEDFDDLDMGMIN